MQVLGGRFSPGLRAGTGGRGRAGQQLSAQQNWGSRECSAVPHHPRLNVAFSNLNTKPGAKRVLRLALLSVPWNICRHGDPSPGFFFFLLTPQDDHLPFFLWVCLHLHY